MSSALLDPTVAPVSPAVAAQPVAGQPVAAAPATAAPVAADPAPRPHPVGASKPAVIVAGAPEPAELAAALACVCLLARAAGPGGPAPARPARWSGRGFTGPRSWQSVAGAVRSVGAGGGDRWRRS